MKTIASKLLLTFVLYFTITTIYAQTDIFGNYQTQYFGKITPETFDKIAERKLIVVLLEEDPNIVTKLGKNKDPEKLATYKSTITNFNSDIKLVFEALWTMHDSLEFKTWSEISKIPKTEKSNYEIVTFMRYKEALQNTESFEDVSRIDFDNAAIGGSQKTNEIKSNSYEYTMMKIGALQTIKIDSHVWIAMGHLVPTSLDLAFGIAYIQWYLQSKKDGISTSEMMSESKVNCKELPGLTLLISEADAKDNKIMGDDDKKYPYKTEIVPIEKIEEYITLKTPGYAYLNYNNEKACVVKIENNSILYIPYTTALTIQSIVSVSKMGSMVQKIIDTGDK